MATFLRDNWPLDEPVSTAKGVVWAIARASGRAAHVRVLFHPDSPTARVQTWDHQRE